MTHLRKGLLIRKRAFLKIPTTGETKKESKLGLKKAMLLLRYHEGIVHCIIEIPPLHSTCKRMA